ncbi:hypothetical protein GCM10010109_21000 [Actinoplanes campanulatus]|nr:hypothetical protein GCM10010109_21000 [Actinoplanes campanulatus]GID36616.1 hypothetical protein Aca09nite_31220 [Actinoplanes campanulatus]
MEAVRPAAPRTPGEASVIAEIIRRMCWRGRVAAAHAERDAARREAAERSAAVRRILDDGQAVPDPVRAQRRRAA